MFSPLYAASRPKQPVTILASLGLQGALVALLCLMPKTHGPCLRMDNAHVEELRAELVTPVSFLQHITQTRSVATPAPKGSQPKSQHAIAPELPSAAKPMEARVPEEAQSSEPQVQPAEESTVAEATNDASGDSGGGLAPFPSWQMHAGASGHGFVHHQVKTALPVFTPDPPILHGEIPEPARGKDVVMNVIINEEGSIVAVKVLQGIGYGVENSIVETLRKWIYVPAKVNGKAIASQQELRFHFPG